MIKLVLFLLLFVSSQPIYAEECVVLLHGLMRSTGSRNKLEKLLKQDGYHTVNLGYPSRDYPIETLAPLAIEPALAECRNINAEKINFVTHSLGGILVREYVSKNNIPELNRVVMLGPPNQGSEAVDSLRDSPGFERLNGPAGEQLGTDRDSVPRRLGRVDFELGVIAGSNSINPILSQMVPGDDDGKVSIEATKVAGMTDFIVVPASHPFLLIEKPVLLQVTYFLKNGLFEKGAI